MLKKLSVILIGASILFSEIIKADNLNSEPLRVSVTYFTPPFIITSGFKNFTGFDMNMMTYVCYHLKRACEYRAMAFEELLPSITSKQADIAVSGIIITSNRLLQVGMSNPYLVSASRLITYQENDINELTDAALENKKIGVEKGSVFGEQVKNWNIKGVEIIEFSSENDEIQSVAQHNIDFAVMDNYSSIYWVKNSQNKLKLLGNPIVYGYGYGIAIDPNNPDLIDQVNDAIKTYLKSGLYTENYNLYLSDPSDETQTTHK